MTRAHVVIGTAGHVDHGKTSLVEALTGVDCDRLPEEKRRGITIDLGFARWDLPGVTASIVDVPGHERFVQTMVAGAAGIDLVLLVVAADDGVMPQTREHLAICEELGVSVGIVAVTKADLVGDEMLELVCDEVRELARGTFLEGAPIVRCSAREGRGLDEVTSAVRHSLASLRYVPSAGPPWLSIDRVFTKHGFGTIVTGTLLRGTIAIDDALEAMPARDGGVEPVVVRGLYVHDRAVERASATTRLAINLRGADRAQLRRGAVLISAGSQRPTRVLDVELRLFSDAPALDPRTEMVLHVGTAHATVKARALSPIGPARSGVVRLFAQTPIVAHAGQRLVMRRPELGEHRTVAGGTILDPHPRPGRRRKDRPAASTLHASDIADRVRVMIEETSSGATMVALRERLPPDADAAEIVERLVASGALLEAGSGAERRLFARAHLERAQAALLRALSAFHEEHAAASGATVAELAGRLPFALRPLAAPALEALARAGLAAGGDRVRLPGHDARRTYEQVAEAFRGGGLAPDTDDAAREKLSLEARTFRDIVGALERDGTLARVATGLHFHASALDDLRARVAAHFDKQETLSPGEFKDLTGLTRKHAIVLLEWLDKQGVTRRQGDLRVKR